MGALQRVVEQIGRELSLADFHAMLRRAAQDLGSTEYGAMRVTCSDEALAEARESFRKEIVSHLLPDYKTGDRGAFVTDTLGGRWEAGALAVARNNFFGPGRRNPLLLIEVASHVGREGPLQYGRRLRYGKPVPVCGAMSMTLGEGGPDWTGAIRNDIGERRMADLRAVAEPWRMTAAAIAQSVVQAEAAMAEILAAPVDAPCQYLIATEMTVNQQGPDACVPTGLFHVTCDGAALYHPLTQSLRSTPSKYRFSEDNRRLLVSAAADAAAPPPKRDEAAAERRRRILADWSAKVTTRERLSADALKQVDRVRENWRKVHSNEHAYRAYSRPMLRLLVDGLLNAVPFGSLASLAAHGVIDLQKAARLRALLELGPADPEARGAADQVRRIVAVLPHARAQEVLEMLLAEHGQS